MNVLSKLQILVWFQFTILLFKNIKFNDCKLLGVLFENCNDFLFEVEFTNSILNVSSFFKLNMKNTNFKNCTLKEVDFSQCNLSASSFENCDLEKAVFDRTILDKADFRTSFNFSIDPTKNQMKRAKFTNLNLAGLLDSFDLDIRN